jgi:hypothetical protein
MNSRMGSICEEYRLVARQGEENTQKMVGD